MSLPFILRFGVESSSETPNYSLVEYSPKLQLSVVVDSGEPAISYLPLDTDTFTKTMGEVSDPDRDIALLSLMDTTTDTRRYFENTDTDADATMHESIRDVLDTDTFTETRVESTDTDRDQ